MKEYHRYWNLDNDFAKVLGRLYTHPRDEDAEAMAKKAVELLQAGARDRLSVPIPGVRDPKYVEMFNFNNRQRTRTSSRASHGTTGSAWWRPGWRRAWMTRSTSI